MTVTNINMDKKKKLTPSERSKIWREENREKVNAYAREYSKRPHVRERQTAATRNWRHKNIEYMREYWKKYGQKPEQITYDKKYWVDHKEKLSLEYKKWSQENRHVVRAVGYRYFTKNKTKVHKRNKIYRQNNMDKVLFWNGKRRVAKRNIEGSHTLEQWLELRKNTNGICPKCKKNVGLKKLTKDHIVPISKKGTDNIDNIQPLCKQCNSSKRELNSTKYI